MKIIRKHKGEIKLEVTKLEDLWYLSQVIDARDLVKAKTLRKIKLGDDDERNTKVIKKPVTLIIEVEKVEFHKYSNSLRVSGIVKEGPEDIAKGVHHTLDVELNTFLTITKDKWLNYQTKQLDEAAKEEGLKVLICVMDRENATFALLKKYGYDVLSELEGDVRKKGEEDKKTENKFYLDIIKNLRTYYDKYKIEQIVLASPAFWKEDLLKVIEKKEPELKKIITLATCSSFGKNSINEVLKRAEVKKVIEQERAIKEFNIVEELFKEISLAGKGVYGFKNVKNAVESGAVKDLLITDDLIHNKRQEGTFDELNELMKMADQTAGIIHIISTDHEAGEKLKGLGGIGAILRYKISY